MNKDNNQNQELQPVNPPSAQASQTPPIQSAPGPVNPEPKKKKKIVLIIIVSVLAAVLLSSLGLFVYTKMTALPDEDHSQHTTTQKDDGQPPPEETEIDPTADWIAITSKAGKYSFKHPKAWTTESAGDPDLCTAELTLLATSKENIAKCPSESLGQMAFDSVLGDQTTQYKVSYPSTPATTDGVTGVRYEGEITSTSEEGIGPEAGTREIFYVFYDGTRTYRAMYYQYPHAEDISETFDLLVTETLKFQKS